MWVVGSFVPVVLSLPVAAGNLVMAVVAAIGAVSYMSSRRAARGRRRGRPSRDADRARQPCASAQLLLELVDLVRERAGQLVAEGGEVLADARHLGPPLVGVDGQQLLHVGGGDVETVGVDGPGAGMKPIGVSVASPVPLTRSKTHSRTREFSP